MLIYSSNLYVNACNQSLSDLMQSKDALFLNIQAKNFKLIVNIADNLLNQRGDALE